MGIGIGQGNLLRVLAESGGWVGLSSVCELGSQRAQARELRDLFALHGKPSPNGKLNGRELYLGLGLTEYTSIDINGEHGALCFDLNKDLVTEYGFNTTFDLVTDFGTAEHCFNQFEVFRNIHRLCRPGGYMLHTLPTQGWGRHCFYRYDANFFEDLAAANEYRILKLQPFLRINRYLRSHKSRTLRHLANLCVHIESRVDSARSLAAAVNWLAPGRSRYFTRPEPSQAEVDEAVERIGKENALFSLTMACAMQKTRDQEFVTPIQGMYKHHA